jgi:hypothetical protein
MGGIITDRPGAVCPEAPNYGKLQPQRSTKSQAPNYRQVPNHKHQITNKDQTAKRPKFQTNNRNGKAPTVCLESWFPALVCDFVLVFRFLFRICLPQASPAPGTEFLFGISCSALGSCLEFDVSLFGACLLFGACDLELVCGLVLGISWAFPLLPSHRRLC